MRPPLPCDSDARLPRREFLQRTGASLLGAAVLPRLPYCGGTSALAVRAKLGMQLYTVRDAIKLDMPGTLRRVASLGFEGVETAFWPDDVTLAQASAALREAGLPVSSCHIVGPERSLDTFEAERRHAPQSAWHARRHRQPVPNHPSRCTSASRTSR